MASSEENKDVFYVGRDTVEDELRELYLITGVRIKQEDIFQIARDIVKSPSKYPHLFLPIVDKALGIQEEADYDGTTEDTFPGLVLFRLNREQALVINGEDQVPKMKKFYP